MTQTNYNPDVLTCLANLSNDEVFTPPSVVNQMLDLLPSNLWSDPDVKFLDPVTKSGVFLREIAKRLMKGLEDIIPDKQNRINHIMTKQLFGIAITELTALLSRRSVYCSKMANEKYSICNSFFDEQGNIIFNRTLHSWINGKCKYCGASQEIYDRGDEFETHAYKFIHTNKPEDIFSNMKFDVIIGNPPYQLTDGGGMKNETASGSAIPLYQKFVQQAKKLNPRYLTMIVPARWFSGGRGLDEFRNEMLNDNRITELIDYTDSRDCFPGVDIAGGICYFLWDRDNPGLCKTTNIYNNKVHFAVRKLNEFAIFVRYAISENIIKKVLKKNETLMSNVVYSSKPFGFRSFEEGEHSSFDNAISLFGSKGLSYVKLSDVASNVDLIYKWKVIISKTSAEHAGQADKEGRKRVLSRIEILSPGTICSESYLLLKVFDTEREALNLFSYAKTNFFRFMMSTILLTQNIAKDKFAFVPMQDFDESWTDEKLYIKYGLTEDEIAFIDSMIRPMDLTKKNEVDE